MALISPRRRIAVATMALACGLLACYGAIAPAASATAPAQARASGRGTISGVITDHSGNPLQGICVHGIGGPPFPATNSSGAFSVKARAKNYVLFFASGCGTTVNWVTQRYTNGKFPYRSAIVHVRAGHATKLGVTALTLGGEITGQVTGRHGQLSGVCILLIKPNKRYVASPLENDINLITNGKPFALTGVVAGRYSIQFTTVTCGNTGNYANQFWQGALSLSAATTVTVRPGQVVSGIDQQLPAGAVITGRVTGQAGVPLAGVCVTLNVQGWEPDIANMATTGADGGYRAQALTTGKYSVSFDPTCGGAVKTPYQPLSYSHEVTVTDGKVTRGIGARLSTSG